VRAIARLTRSCAVVALILWAAGNVFAQILAFPEAEGFGRYATGARTSLSSATVYHVTNLNESGAGSFRDAVSQPNRFVVFDVGGIVTVPPTNSPIVVQDNVTIAGQTAPGGFAVYGNRVTFSGANNTIARYLAIHKGEAGYRDDASGASNGVNMMFDHLSVTWGVDETFSLNWDGKGSGLDNITIQDSIIAQGQDRLGHSAGGLMTLPQGSRFSVIRSVFADNVTRNPKVRGENEFINNVIYGYETAGYIMGDTVNMTSHANAIGNYFIEGPVNGSSPFASGTPQFEIYGADNWVDGNRNGVLDGSLNTSYPGATVASTPFAFPSTAKMTAQQAIGYVMQHAGLSITRDPVDARIMEEIASYGTVGGVIQRETDLFPGYGSDPKYVNARARLSDADNDGMPDNWERARGLNPASASDWKTLSGGYTNLELYLNELGGNETSSRWTATSGTWGAAGAWSGGTPTLATVATVSGTTSLASGQAFARRLTVGDATAGRVNVTGGSLDVFESLRIGQNASATLSLSGGAIGAGEIVLGGTAASPGDGFLMMTGGTLQASYLRADTPGSRFDWYGGLLDCTSAPSVTVPTMIALSGGTISVAANGGSWSGPISGPGGLVKQGVGTLTLSASNTMTGGVRVQAGTVAVNHIAAIGGGSLTLAGGNVSFGSVSGIQAPIVVQSSGTVSAGGITLNGSISGGSAVRLGIATTTTGNLTMSGSLSPFAGTLDFGPSTGNVRLNGYGAEGSSSATFDLGSSTAAIRTAFAATVSLGALTGGTGTKLQGATNTNGLVTYVVGGKGLNTTFSGLVTDGVYATPGITGLTKVGSGALTLGNAASTYSGATRVSGGVLAMATLANGGTASSIGQSAADAANLVLDGGTLRYTGGATSTDRGITITPNGGGIEMNGTGNVSWTATGALVMEGNGDRTFSLSGTSTAFNNFSAGIGDPSSGVTTLVKGGVGTWRLFGSAKTYSGDTLVNGGSLFLVTANVLPHGMGKGNVSVGAGALLDLYGNSHTINGLFGAGTVTTTINTSRTLSIGDGNADGDFGGVLTQGASQTLAVTKFGTGTQRLSGSSSYTGGTQLRGGTLVAAAAGALGTGTVTITGSAQSLVLTTSATFSNPIQVFGGGSASTPGLIRYEGAGRGVLDTGTVSLVIAPTAGSLFGSSGGGELLVNSPISATAGVKVSIGSGTVVLGGAGTYTDLEVGQGMLRLGRTGGLPTAARVVIGTTGSATFDLSGFDQTLAGISQGAGVAVIGNSSTTRDAMLTLTAGSSFAGTIRDSIGGGTRKVSLTLSGGTTTLSGSNAYTGTTLVSSGLLDLGSGGSLSSSPVVVMAGGSVRLGSGASAAAPAVTVLAGGEIQLPVDSTVTVATNRLTLSGLMDLGAGRLEIASGGVQQSALVAALATGRGDGSWNGTSGIASAAAETAIGGGQSRAVGWLANGDSSFSVSFTAPGDTNLDGAIDILDIANFVSSGAFDMGLPSVWFDGDFNYDGSVDLIDAADMLGTGLFDQGGFLPGAGQVAAVASVPEPATGLLAGLMLIAGGVVMTARGLRKGGGIVGGAFVAAVLVSVAPAATIHVAPSGDDAADSTSAKPLASVSHAVSRARPGDTVLLLDGTFACPTTIMLSGSGTADAPITLRAADGAKPVLCFDSFRPADEKVRAVSRGIFLGGDHWILQGLEICHAPDNGLKIEGCHNRVDRCVFHHNGDSGLQIGLAKKSKNDGTLAAHNEVVNCDSFRNFDPRTKGENADGFACKLFPGPGNRFVGCRAWENADDGWDLFMTTFPVEIEHCWAWHNGDPELFPVQGSYSGDGNGFKLGGQDRPASHRVRWCVAFDHPFGSGNGFEDNNNTAPITLQHCTAWGNKTNFQFKKAAHVLENCASFAPTKSKAGVAFDADVVCRTNTWLPDPNPKKKGKYVAGPSDEAFTGLEVSLAGAERGVDGSLPDNGFARPKPGGSVIDQGTDLGLPYTGTAPDLGAFELVVWPSSRNHP